MTKYRNSGKNIGKRILAVALAVATIVTTGSFNMEALAAGGTGDTPGYTIPKGGYLGEIITNSETSNQKVDSVKVKIVQQAGASYTYSAYVSQNPTDSTDPLSGVERVKAKTGTIPYSGEEQEVTIDVPIGKGDNNKDIILTPNEKLGVAIKLSGTQGDVVEYFEKSTGTGFRRNSDNDTWEARGDIIEVVTSPYTGTVDDVNTVTFTPEKTILTKGEADIDFTTTLTPNYQRDISYSSTNSDVAKVTGNKIHAGYSGEAEITATCGTKTDTKKLYVLENTVQDGPFPYTGDEIKPSVTVKCGDTTLTENTDYRLTYDNNVNPGTATVTITGIGTYLGYTKSYDYQIVNATLTQSMVTNGIYSIDTTTGELKSAIITTEGTPQKTLVQDVDFEASATYERSTSSTVTYSVKVEAKGSYTSETGNPLFTEVELSAGSTTIDINAVVDAELENDIDTFYYTGDAVTPKVFFRDKGGTLVDFGDNVKVTYSTDTTTASEDDPKVVTITGIKEKGYSGTATLEYWVLPRELSDSSITISIEEETPGSGTVWTHTGYDIKPTVTIDFTVETPTGTKTTTLTKDTDFKVTYSGNKDVGTATIMISGMGNFDGTVSKNFQIIADFVKDASLKIGGSLTNYSKNFESTYATTYTGREIKPRISAFQLAGRSCSDYTYEFDDNVKAGIGKVIVKGTGIYDGKEFTATFKINPKQLTGSVSVNQLPHTYSNSEVELTSGEYAVYDGSTLLGTDDYDVSYLNNINAGQAVIQAKGKGNYTGTISGTFTIDPLSLNAAGITVDPIKSRTYDGSAQTPSVVVKKDNVVVPATNYDLSYSDNVNVGTATVTITGKNNYKDSRYTTFEITPKSLENLEYVLGGSPCSGSGSSYESEYEATYTGLEIKPEVTIYENGHIITKDGNYSVQYVNQINASDTQPAVAIITGQGPYTGSIVQITYKINKKAITQDMITMTGTEKRADGKTYPKVVVEDSSGSYGKKTLKEYNPATKEGDYEIIAPESASHAGPDNVATIKGVNNYYGEQTVTYEIGKNLSTKGKVELQKLDGSSVTPSGNTYTFEYMGNNRPIHRVFYLDGTGSELRENIDYTISPDSYEVLSGTDYNAGALIKVTATGIGDYYGEAVAYYTITPKSLEGLTISDGNPAKTTDWSYIYDTKTKEVIPTIKYVVSSDITVDLTKGTDFTLSRDDIGADVMYDSSGNITSATVHIYGNVNYTGTRDVSLIINPYSLRNNDIAIPDIGEKQYTGSQITPAFTVTRTFSWGTETIPAKEYDATYGENIVVGTGTGSVKATGKGNYKDDISATFNIVQKQLTQENTRFVFDNGGSYEYNGTAKEPGFSVYVDGNTPLEKDVDYEVVTYANNTYVGVGNVTDHTGPTVQIKGIGKYEGTVYGAFTIYGDLNNSSLFELSGLSNSYTINNGDIDVTGYKIKYKGTDIEVPAKYYANGLEKPSPILPGNDGWLAVRGDGTVLVGRIVKENITFVGKLSDANVYLNKTQWDYTGSAIEPDVTIIYGTKRLYVPSECTVTYSNNTNVGTTGRADISSGCSYLTGTNSATFSIKYNLNNAVVTGYNKNYEYTGSALPTTPLVVKVGNQVLTKDTDYTESITNNTNVGQATITITAPANSNSYGTWTDTFNINAISINSSNCTVDFDSGPYTYSGNSIQPIATVTYNGGGTPKVLTATTDYKIEYPEDSVSVGPKNVKIRGTGNYVGNLDGTYTISPANINDVDINVSPAEYAGPTGVMPEYTITYNGKPLTLGTDYTVNVSDNTTVRDDAKITFTGIGNFSASTTEKPNPRQILFKVGKRDLSKGTVQVEGNSSVYTGSAIEPSMKVWVSTGRKDASGEDIKYYLTKGTDYTVTYNGFSEMVDVGKYSITVQGEGNFVNSLVAEYEVTAKPIEESEHYDITLVDDEGNPKEDWDYTGSAVTPKAIVKDKDRNNLVLTEGTDYTLEYANNTAAGSKDSENPPTVKIIGKGNYGGEVDKTFNIGHSLATAIVTIDQTYSLVYDGTEKKPNVTGVRLDGKDLVKDTDYKVTYSPADNLIDAGDKKVVVTGIEGYYGSVETTYTVQKKTAKAEQLRVVLDYEKDEQGNYITTYNGKAKEPVVTVYDDSISTTVPVKTSDYRVTYVNNTNVSTDQNPAYVIVHMQGNYADGSDEKMIPFYIKAKTITSGFEVALKTGTQQPYTGSAVKPEIAITPTDPELVGKVLVEGTDYTVEYKNNVNAGPATATVTGIGNYSGTVELPFNVVASFADAEIVAPDQFYNGGNKVEAPLTITCGGNTLKVGEDYNVVYTSEDNWENTGTAHITPIPEWYSGDFRDVTYKILFDPTMLTVTNYANEYAYTGEPIKPNFKVVTPSGTEVAYDPDMITYTNSNTGEGDCTSIGTITATIPLNVGTKTCELTATYDIIGRNINLCDIVPLYDNVYTGQAIYPPVLIRNEKGELLTEGVDYTLKYSDNVNPGVGRIDITGIGNYIATVTKYFNIIAPEVLQLKGSTASDTSVNLSWLRNANISGYEIYSADSSVKYGSTTNTSYTVTGLKQATEYTFKVRTFITVGGKTTFGNFKTVTVRTGLSAPTITVRSLARQRTTLNWTPASGVTGYEIYRSVSLNGTYNKIAVMPQSAGGYSDANLVSGGTYYYKVRAYQKVGENQFVYGYFSAPVAVTVR